MRSNPINHFNYMCMWLYCTVHTHIHTLTLGKIHTYACTHNTNQNLDLKLDLNIQTCKRQSMLYIFATYLLCSPLFFLCLWFYANKTSINLNRNWDTPTQHVFLCVQIWFKVLICVGLHRICGLNILALVCDIGGRIVMLRETSVEESDINARMCLLWNSWEDGSARGWSKRKTRVILKSKRWLWRTGELLTTLHQQSINQQGY